MNDQPDHYSVLGLKRDCSQQAIKQQYRRLAKVYHPDRNPGEEMWCSEQLTRVNEAWRVLSNPMRRREYDGKIDPTGQSGDPGPSVLSVGRSSTRPVKRRDGVFFGICLTLLGVAVCAGYYIARTTATQSPQLIAPAKPAAVHETPRPRPAIISNHRVHVVTHRIVHARKRRHHAGPLTEDQKDQRAEQMADAVESKKRARGL